MEDPIIEASFSFHYHNGWHYLLSFHPDLSQRSLYSSEKRRPFLGYSGNDGIFSCLSFPSPSIQMADSLKEYSSLRSFQDLYPL